MSSSTSRHARSFLPAAFSVAGREMDDLFDRLFQPDSNGQSHRFSAPVAIWEEGEHFYVEVEMAGVTQDAIDLTFEKGFLKVSAKRESPASEERKYIHNERSYGDVTRTISVPEGVDPESIDAELSNGILRLQLTKRPEVVPKKIEVRTK